MSNFAVVKLLERLARELSFQYDKRIDDLFSNNIRVLQFFRIDKLKKLVEL